MDVFSGQDNLDFANYNSHLSLNTVIYEEWCLLGCYAMWLL
jgi:hypothetical protein